MPYMFCVCAVFTNVFHLLYVFADVLHLLRVFIDACMCCLCAVFADVIPLMYVCCIHRYHTCAVYVLCPQIPTCAVCVLCLQMPCMCCICAVFTDALHVLSVCCVYRCPACAVCVLCLQMPTCAVCVLCLQMPTCAVFTDILRVLFGGLHVHVTCGLPAVPLPPGTLSYAMDFFLPRWRNSHSEYSVLHLLLSPWRNSPCKCTLYCIFSFLLGEIHPVNVLCTAFSHSSLEKFTQ